MCNNKSCFYSIKNSCPESLECVNCEWENCEIFLFDDIWYFLMFAFIYSFVADFRHKYVCAKVFFARNLNSNEKNRVIKCKHDKLFQSSRGKSLKIAFCTQFYSSEATLFSAPCVVFYLT